MNRTEFDRLQDILNAIHGAQDAVGGLDYETFAEIGPLFASLCYYVMVISEASRHISDERKAQFSHIRWRQMADIGNVIRHVYFKVDSERLWNIYLNDMPVLELAIREMLKDFPGGGD